MLYLQQENSYQIHRLSNEFDLEEASLNLIAFYMKGRGYDHNNPLDIYRSVSDFANKFFDIKEDDYDAQYEVISILCISWVVVPEIYYLDYKSYEPVRIDEPIQTELYKYLANYIFSKWSEYIVNE